MYANLHCVIFSVMLVFQLIKGLMNDAKLLITNSQLQSPLTKIRSVFTAKEMPNFRQIRMSHLLICQALVMSEFLQG